MLQRTMAKSPITPFITNPSSPAKDTRQIELIRVLPLHGTPFECHTVEEAIAFVENYNWNDGKSKPMMRYEVVVRYTNGESCEG